MHCFEGHNVVTLGEMASKDSGRHDIHELDSLCKFIQVDFNMVFHREQSIQI